MKGCSHCNWEPRENETWGPGGTSKGECVRAARGGAAVWTEGVRDQEGGRAS